MKRHPMLSMIVGLTTITLVVAFVVCFTVAVCVTLNWAIHFGAPWEPVAKALGVWVVSYGLIQAWSWLVLRGQRNG